MSKACLEFVVVVGRYLVGYGRLCDFCVAMLSLVSVNYTVWLEKFASILCHLDVLDATTLSHMDGEDLLRWHSKPYLAISND